MRTAPLDGLCSWMEAPLADPHPHCLPVHIVMILIGIHGISYSRGAWLPLRWRHMAVGLGKVIWLVGMEVAFLVHLLILWRFGQKLWIA